MRASGQTIINAAAVAAAKAEQPALRVGGRHDNCEARGGLEDSPQPARRPCNRKRRARTRGARVDGSACVCERGGGGKANDDARAPRVLARSTASRADEASQCRPNRACRASCAPDIYARAHVLAHVLCAGKVGRRVGGQQRRGETTRTPIKRRRASIRPPHARAACSLFHAHSRPTCWRRSGCSACLRSAGGRSRCR